MDYPCKKCETCNRYDKKEMRQKNLLYCTFSCEEYQYECIKAAHLYNYAVSGDPNIYGINGTVIKPTFMDAEE